jgi:hypothetical protein
MKQLLVYTFLTYLACIGSVLLLNEVLIERQSREDVEGFTLFSLGYLIVLTGFFYFPFLSIIDRKYQGSLRKYYPLISGFLLNVPFFIFAIVMSGKAFQPTEGLLFSMMYIVVGYVFGKLFSGHKTHREKFA